MFSQPNNMNDLDLSISCFLKDGFNLKKHLIDFLNISNEQLDQRLLNGVDDLAALHPGAFTENNAGEFYEEKVGDAHLIDLASWHLNSSSYIADTLRLQQKFASGKVLDFGGVLVHMLWLPRFCQRLNMFGLLILTLKTEAL